MLYSGRCNVSYSHCPSEELVEITDKRIIIVSRHLGFDTEVAAAALLSTVTNCLTTAEAVQPVVER